MAKTLRCPVCRSENEQCRALAITPGGRVQWVAREPHDQRAERTRD